MKTAIGQILLASVVASIVLPGLVNSAEPAVSGEVTLKEVMQGLLEDSVDINKGVFLEDYSMIEQAASSVADHPTPSMATRKKLMMKLGLEMGNFKSLDTVVHDLAVEIGEAARNKDMNTVVVKYHKLIDGCLSCHNDFKSRVSDILK